MQAANERYLSFMASIDNPNAGTPSTAKPVRENDRFYRGFNLFPGEDHSLFITLARGAWNISGFRASTSEPISAISPPAVPHNYYLTTLGRRVLTTALALREYVVLPSLGSATA